MRKKPKKANGIAFGREPTVSVEHIFSIGSGNGETLVTIEHGIAVRTYTTPGKLTKADALKNYKDGAWLIDFTDSSNAVGFCIEILKRNRWIGATAPFAPLQAHINNFEAEKQNTDFATWEFGPEGCSQFTPLVWAIEKAGLRYEPEWYAAQVLRHFEGPPDVVFVAGYMFRELTLRYRHEDDALRGKKTKMAAAEGGNARVGKLKDGTEKILEMMQSYLDKNPNKTAAARHTYNKGLGASTDANLQLFKRHKK